ncbi:MAG: VanZ family protein [Sediminibacterium sp.]|nr:VanZ family protein [Sediminibacterium sp.]
MTNSFKTFIWVIFEFVLIFILLSMPSSGEPGKGWISYLLELPFADKIIHVGLFGSLALSLFFHLEQYSNISFRSTRTKALSLILCIVFGIGMEFYQKYFVPSRGFEVGDMLADAMGALLALPFFNGVKRFIQPKVKSI